MNIEANCPERQAGVSFKGLRVVHARTPDLLTRIYRLRYRAYRAEEVIEPNAAEVFIDSYDMSRTSIPLAVVEDGLAVVGAIRLAVQPPTSVGVLDFRSSPEFTIFPDVIAPLLADDRAIFSAARLCIEPGHPRRSQIAMLIVLALTVAARATGAKWGIATARGGHVKFYKRFCKMALACEPRPMPNLSRSYSLLVADIDTSYGPAIASFPETCRAHFFQEHPEWPGDIAATVGSFPLPPFKGTE